jgi:hypothetical protein
VRCDGIRHALLRSGPPVLRRSAHVRWRWQCGSAVPERPSSVPVLRATLAVGAVVVVWHTGVLAAGRCPTRRSSGRAFGTPLTSTLGITVSTMHLGLHSLRSPPIEMHSLLSASFHSRKSRIPSALVFAFCLVPWELRWIFLHAEYRTGDTAAGSCCSSRSRAAGSRNASRGQSVGAAGYGSRLFSLRW